jgi:hypothetical protein
MLLLPALAALIQLKIVEFFEAGKAGKKSPPCSVPGSVMPRKSENSTYVVDKTFLGKTCASARLT